MLPRADFKRSQRKTWNSLPAPSCRGGGRTRPHPRSRSTGLGDNHMHHYDRAGQGRPNSQYTMWRHHAIETKPRHKARHGDRDFTAYLLSNLHPPLLPQLTSSSSTHRYSSSQCPRSWAAQLLPSYGAHGVYTRIKSSKSTITIT